MRKRTGMKCRIISYFIVLISISTGALSAPVISGISGTPSDGSIITISGLGFGIKNPARPYLWAPFNNNLDPDGSLGRRLTRDSYMDSHIQYDPSSSNCYGGKAGCLRDNLTDRDGEGWTWGVDTDIDGWYINSFSQKSYVYMKRKRNFTITADNNWKVFRAWSASYTFPNFYYQAGNGNANVEGGTSYCWANHPENLYSWKDTWNTDEYILLGNSSLQAINGSFRVYTNNNLILKCDGTSYTWAMRTGSGNIRMVFLAHGIMEDLSFPGTNNHEWFDDIYFDNTWSRVMISDSSTWIGSTNKEIQIPMTWSDTSIQIKFNVGIYNTGQNVYLYVVDANNNVNANGYNITIGGAGGGRIPSSPSGVQIR